MINMHHFYNFLLWIYASLPAGLALNHAQQCQLIQQVYIFYYFQRLVNSN